MPDPTPDPTPNPKPTDRVDAALLHWTQATFPGLMISLTPPDEHASGQGISFYLLALGELPTTRAGKRPPLQVLLRYLVTSWADDPQVAHDLLGQAAFAALEATEQDSFQVEFDPPPLDLWIALKVAPRPSFVLGVPLRRERPQIAEHYVRKPLVVQVTPTISVQGQVRGPQQIPIANALVEVVGLQRQTVTDAGGHFALPALSRSLPQFRLRISAKGREQLVDALPQLQSGEPILIDLDLSSPPP